MKVIIALKYFFSASAYRKMRDNISSVCGRVREMIPCLLIPKLFGCESIGNSAILAHMLS